MSDILTVRQIAQYTPTDAVGPNDWTLIQRGGVGGPYMSVPAPNVVSSALEMGGFLKLAPGNGIAWNGASLIWDPTGWFLFSESLFAPLINAAELFVNDQPVASQLFVEELFAIPKVDSFNFRTGNVQLEEADILRAGGILQNNPHFTGLVLVPTPWDFRNASEQAANCAWVQGVIEALLCSGSVVTSFNGRGGDITLTGDDITSAATANGARPQVNTAPYGDASKRIANTLFVSEAIYNLNMTLRSVILEASEAQLSGYATLNSPQFTGVPTAPTAAPGTSTGQLATTAYVEAAVTAATTGVSSFNTRTGAVTLVAGDITSAGGALLASPVFTGTPQAPTAAVGTSTQQLATTAFVAAAVAAATTGVASFNGRTGAVTLTVADITGAGGAPVASPTFTGNPAAPTQTTTDSSTKLATTAFVHAAIAAIGTGVTSFNSRTGAVTLTAADISAAGGAPLASPALTGTPTAPTATAGTATTQLATTAFVMAALTATGVASFNGRTGAITLISSDISTAGGALLASPAFSGTPTAPNPAPGTNNTQIATTSFVMAAVGGSVVSTFNGRSGAVTLATADITGAGGAALASPSFSGTPSAPTATAGTSTTQLATCAFVMNALGSGGVVNTFNGRAGAVTLQAADVSAVGGALLASPVFTGTPSAPTATTGTASNQLATCQFVLNELGTLGGVTTWNGRAGNITMTAADITSAGGALIASPTFTGAPAAPTAAPGTSSTQLATCAFVAAAIAGNPTLTQSDTAPTVSGNALWFDSVGGQLYVQYIDPSTSAKSWVIANSPQPVVQPPASGSRVLLSSSAVTTPVVSVNFFTGFDGTYDELEFHIYDVAVATVSNLALRCSLDGSTFDAGSNYQYMFYYTASNATSGVSGAGATSGLLGNSVDTMPNTLGHYLIVRVRFAPAGLRTAVIYEGTHTNSTSFTNYVGGVVYTGTGPIKGLQFMVVSNYNITRGTFKLYGIVK